MQRIPKLALLAATFALVLGPTAAGAATPVTVRVEGSTHELLAPTSVRVGSGTVKKNGGRCSANSGAGAFDAATHHRWSGTFYPSLNDFFITSIFGEAYTKTSKAYWSVFVNNVSSSVGLCTIKPRRGEQILVAAVPTTGPVYPLALRGPGHARAGSAVTVKVNWYTAKGKATPLRGAQVSGGGLSGVTAANGRVTLRPAHAGRLKLTATRTGYIRPAPLVVRVTG